MAACKQKQSSCLVILRRTLCSTIQINEFNLRVMKVKYLTLIGTALVLATTCKVAAQSSSNSTDVKLTPPAKTLLCKEFPLNSRCSSTSTPDSSTTPSSTTPANPPTSDQQTAPTDTDRNGKTPAGTNPPGNPNTTKPGSTTPPVGTPPAPGSQQKPYVTPQ